MIKVLFIVREKVTIEGESAEGFIRVVTDTGAVYNIPSHIVKKTA